MSSWVSNVLLTGMPRSGTTMATAIVNQQPNAIGLAEPIQLVRHGDRSRAVEEIRRFVVETRASLLAKDPVATKHVGGSIPYNWVEPPTNSDSLRRVLEERSEITFSKALTKDFTLVVKHPAEFTALLDLLRIEFKVFAVVRNPVEVLAAWQTVDMPVNRGTMPMLEAFAPPAFIELLNSATTNLHRQVLLIEFQLKTYSLLPSAQLIRYEDILVDANVALRPILPISVPPVNIVRFNPKDRYPGVNWSVLVDALGCISKLIEDFGYTFPDKQIV